MGSVLRLFSVFIVVLILIELKLFKFICILKIRYWGGLMLEVLFLKLRKIYNGNLLVYK